MRNKFRFDKIFLLLLLVTPAAAVAQNNSSINAFSPYTFYGIGDLSVQGPTYMRSMGGVGLGFRSNMRVNSLNPASLSAMNQKSFLFNMGMEGLNVYSQSPGQKTSYNTFNFHDLTVQFPLGKGIAVSANITPLSNVGYRVEMFETNPEVIASAGSVKYLYAGSGSITQSKISLGAQIFKGFSLGADFLIYHGNITRTYTADITAASPNVMYNNTLGGVRSDYSSAWFNLGMQLDLVSTDKRVLTLGATYQPKRNLHPTVTRSIATSSTIMSYIDNSTEKTNYYLPTIIRAGLYFETPRIGTGLDIGLRNWGSENTPEYDNIEYVNTMSVNAGVQYTPNIMDDRKGKGLNRVTYRLGFRYEDYYLKINDQDIKDMAISAGLGLPMRSSNIITRGINAINFGVELGQRGRNATVMSGTQQFNMIKENYVKFSIGLSLFGEDYWFQKYKYN